MIEKVSSNSNHFLIKEGQNISFTASSNLSFQNVSSIEASEQATNKNFSCLDCITSFFKRIWDLITWPFVKLYERIFPKEPDPFDKKWLDNRDLFLYFLHLSRTHDFESLALSNVLHVLSPENISAFLQDFSIDQLTKPLCISIHLRENHWGLLYIDPIKHTIEYYDSKKDYEDLDFIQIFLDDLKTHFDQKVNVPFTVHLKIEESLQPDPYQCGIWLLYFLENRLQNPEVDFNQLDHAEAQEMIAKFRKKVKKVIKRVKREVETIKNQDRGKTSIGVQAHAMEGNASSNYFGLWKDRYRKLHESAHAAPLPSTRA